MKIVKTVARGKTTLRLIGRFQAEHIEELTKEIQNGGPAVVLDLQELTLLDVDVVRLLGASEASEARLVNCSQYVREWIDRERQAADFG